MKKDTIVVIVIIVLGFAMFLMGVLINELVWCIIGGLVIILPPIVLKIKRKRDRKSLIHYIENDQPNQGDKSNPLPPRQESEHICLVHATDSLVRNKYCWGASIFHTN